MADVFFSYARSDRERVDPLIELVESAGFSVWWDNRIGAGASFDRVIEQALREASCVVVVWSPTSVDSDWVRDEAQDGHDRGILVPICIDDVKPPLGFGRTQTVSLPANVDRADAEVKSILGAISSCVGRAASVNEGRAPRPDRRAVRWFSAAILLLMVGSIGYFVSQPSGSGSNADALVLDSIAVLPLMDLTPEGKNQFLGQSIADELIKQLWDLENIQVPSLTTVAALQKQGKSVRDIGDILDVASVLEGSIRGDGEDLLIRARLIDVRADRTIWSQDFDYHGGNALSAQQQLAREVLLGLQPGATSEDIERVMDMGTTNEDAYADYIVGVYLYGAFSPESIRQSLARFDRALKFDPAFQSAKLAKAFAISTLSFAFADRSQIQLGEALISELKQEGVPAWAEPQLELTLAYMRGGPDVVRVEERSARESMLRRGVADLENLSTYGRALAKSGLLELAAEYFLSVLEMDSDDIAATRWLGQVYANQGRTAEALQLLERALQLSQGRDAVAQYAITGLRIASGQAKELLVEAEPKIADPFWHNMYILALAADEQVEESRHQFEAFTKRCRESPDTLGCGRLWPGHVALWWGDLDRAFTAFDETLAAGDGLADFFLFRQFFWPPERVAEIRNDPRYVAHLERIGLTAQWANTVCERAKTLTPITGIETSCNR